MQVPNLDEAIASAEERGWKVVGVNKQSPSWKEAFIHPKQVRSWGNTPGAALLRWCL